jgi:amidase
MDIELCFLSAAEAIALFKAKKLSPVELLQALIERAREVESQINAFSYEYFDEALAAASAAEQQYVNGNPRPLEGIAVAIKDETFIKGKITSNGSLLMQDFVAETTSPIAERLLEAGAIVHARTTTPEFSISATTFSKLWGVTRNPWNLDITCGGSSGGSGASLAAGTTTLANGSDIGGSIRIPSSLNGVVGFKAPYGRNPEDPPFNLEYYNHPGAMARSVADCILMQNVISGPHPLDIASQLPKLVIPTTFDDIKHWRIAYSLDLGYHEVDPQVRENTLAALEVFKDLGATVEEVNLGCTEKCTKAALDHLSYCVMGSYVLQFYREDKDRMTGYARKFAEMVQAVNIMEALEAEITAGEMWVSLSAVFEKHKLFICPTIANTGVKADLDYSKEEVEINGTKVDPTLGWVMTYPFNMLSRCPVLAVPSGKGANNVPTGIQIVGHPYDDISVFQAALAYEDIKGPLCSASSFPQGI